jgi:hypothetical protein
MKISEVIHQLESEKVVNPVINDLIKETLHYLSSLCKTNGQWDLTLIDELEEEQTYTPTELIMLINDITLSFAQNAVVPIIEYDTNNERNVVLPAIKTKSRRIDINQLPSFEPPLICILQQVISINEAKRVDDQQLVDISRLLQCYLAHCANLQFSVLWDEEYDRTTQATKARDYKKAFSNQHKVAREEFHSYVINAMVINEETLTVEELVASANSMKDDKENNVHTPKDEMTSWSNIGQGVFSIWSEHFYEDAIDKLNN